MTLRLKALDHVGLLVTDLDCSLRFYVDGLGMELTRRRESAAVVKIGDQELDPVLGSRSCRRARRAASDRPFLSDGRLCRR